MADTIITVSQFSRNEISHYCGRSPDKIVVIPEGSDHILRYNKDVSVFERFKIGQRPYILAVSSNSPHKNFNVIVNALNGLKSINFDIVFCGGTFSKVFNSKNLTINHSIYLLGYVSDEELRALYEQAVCFIYPSLYEGFGLPPLEAMACGCPVIVSKAASMPEVCGEAALYFDPLDPVSLADQIKRMIDDPSLRMELCNKGFQQAHIFQWVESARITWKILSSYSNQSVRKGDAGV